MSTRNWIAEGHADPHPDAVVKVTHDSMARGEVVRFLEPGQLFEVANDDPTHTTVEALPDGGGDA
jgi:hypothetical protein